MSRQDALFWRIIAHAATRPLNLLALATMIVVALLTTPLVLVAAVPVYGLLVAGTVRNPREADRIAARETARLLPSGRRDLVGLTGELRRQVVAALSQEHAIMKELDRSPVAPDGLREQVRGLCDELVAAARRGSEIELYLRSVDVAELERRAGADTPSAASAHAGDTAAALREQLEVVRGLDGRRGAIEAEAMRTQATLGAIRARLVAARAEATEPVEVGTDLAALRERLRAMSDALDEVHRQNDDVATGKGP